MTKNDTTYRVTTIQMLLCFQKDAECCDITSYKPYTLSVHRSVCVCLVWPQARWSRQTRTRSSRRTTQATSCSLWSVSWRPNRRPSNMMITTRVRPNPSSPQGAFCSSIFVNHTTDSTHLVCVCVCEIFLTCSIYNLCIYLLIFKCGWYHYNELAVQAWAHTCPLVLSTGYSIAVGDFSGDKLDGES